MKRSVLNSPRLKELKRKKSVVLRNKILLSLFSLLAIFVGLGYLSKWQKLNIENIEITGNKVVETESIEQVVKKNITGRYLWLFPKTNFLIYPKSTIKKELESKFTRLKYISVTVKNMKTLEIVLSERTALYTWCGNNLPDKPEENECYFMDNSGYIFDVAPYFSGEVYFKFFGKAENNYFYKNDFKRVTLFIENLSKMGLKPSSLFIEESGVIDLYLKSNIPLPDGPKIILKLDSDLNKIAENLHTALITEPLQSDFKNKYNSLLYIDLRFGNKVYFKFK
jgi:hypothetical protein